MTTAKPEAWLTGQCAKRRHDERTFEGIGVVRIQSISELERKQWQMATLNEDGEVDYDQFPLAAARLIVIAAVDDKGHRIFTEGQVEQLANLDAKAIGSISEWIQEHCGLDGEDIEATMGNSEETPRGGSP